MRPQEHWPVIIVGAGPTGLTLANLLGAAGIRVLVLERNPSTVHEPRAVSIDDESLRSMQAAGLVDEVLSHVVSGYGSHYFDVPGGRRFATVEPNETPYGYQRRNAFRQPVLERQLRHGLARFPHVTARFEHAVECFNQTSDRIRVKGCGPLKSEFEMSCDYLVGCDGAASSVRRGLNIPLVGSSFEERWLIVDLENSTNPIRHAEVFCNPKRPCIRLPGPDRTCRFEFKVHETETEEDMLAPARVARLLADHGADPRSTIVRTVVYSFHARVATRWAEGRVLLAGDAAHLTPPFAGQGMNSGIRDAHNLAWKLAMVIRGGAGPGILQSYELERRDHVWNMIRLAILMGRIFAPRTEFAGRLVRSGFRVLRLFPRVRDYFYQMKYKPKPRFSSGFLVPDGHGSAKTWVGRLFAQPAVRTSSGQRVLLDEVLGNRFALLFQASDLSQGPDSEAALRQAIWDQLNAVRIAIVRPDVPPPQLQGCEFVIDEGGILNQALAAYPGHLLLLRPDHYVAACLPISAIEQGVRAVSDLIAQTWLGSFQTPTDSGQTPGQSAEIDSVTRKWKPPVNEKHRD